MMKTHSYKNKLTMLLSLAALLILSSQALFSQNLVNGTNGVIVNNGTIKFTTATGVFENINTNAVVTGTPTDIINTGTFEFPANTTNDVFTGAAALGTSADERVPGLVKYSNAAAQSIQGAWYTDLQMADAGQKNFLATTVYCSGSYTAIDGNERDYGTGTFVYDGTADQDIWGESGATGGNDIYNNLTFQNAGQKVSLTENHVEGNIAMEASNTGGVDIQNTFILYSSGGFTQDALAPLTITGVNAQYQHNTDAAGTFAGQITVDAGSFNVNSTGDVTISHANNSIVNSGTMLASAGGDITIGGGRLDVTSGTFSVTNGGIGTGTVGTGATLALADDAGAVIDIQASQSFTVQGSFTNARAMGSRTNMQFAKTSTINYSSSQGNVVGTDIANPYGNVIFTGTTVTAATADDHVRVDGALTVTTGTNLILGSTLAMLDHTMGVTYASGIEVVGAMRRYFNLNGGAYAGAALTYNNAATSVAITSNSSDITEMTLDITPATQPDNIDWDNTTDINRRTVYSYTNSGGSDEWAATIALGYKDDEDPATADDAFRQTLRFREENGANNSEKISTGVAGGLTRNYDFTADADNQFSQVSLAGIRPTESSSTLSLAEVTSTNDIFLRGGPTTFYTINNGRWSNPNTWDEGIQPSTSDIAVVQHTVHVGFRRDAIDGSTANGRIAELSARPGVVITDDKLISQVTITDVDENDPSHDNPALIFGHWTGAGAEADEANAAWQMNDATTATTAGAVLPSTLWNKNETGTLSFTNFDDTDMETVRGNGTLYHGLIILGTNTSFRLNTLTNDGVAGVGGTLEIGHP